MRSQACFICITRADLREYGRHSWALYEATTALASLWPLPLLVPELSSILVLPLTPSYPFGRLSGYGATSLNVSLPPVQPLGSCQPLE